MVQRDLLKLRAKAIVSKANYHTGKFESKKDPEAQFHDSVWPFSFHWYYEFLHPNLIVFQMRIADFCISDNNN